MSSSGESGYHTTSRTLLQGWLVILAFGVLFAPSFSFFSGTSLRFLVYGLLPLSWFFWLMFAPSNRLAVDMRCIIALLLYLSVILVSTFLNMESVDRLTWLNVARPIFYIAVFIPMMVFTNKSVKALVVVFAITDICLWLSGVGTTRGELDFATSRGPLESGIAFPAGALILYFMTKNQKLWALFSFILFFLAFKRIAFAAFLFIGFLMLLSKLLRKIYNFSEYRLALLMMFVVFVVAILINLFYYEFFSILARLMFTEQSILTLTMGRLREFDILYQQFGDQDLTQLLFGNGAGDATRRLVEVTITYPLQVHNSFLLYFYDFGIIGFATIMLAFLIIFSRNSFGLYLMAYNIIIMVTDNTFVHHYHQITYFILISAMQSDAAEAEIRKREAHVT